MPEIGHVYSAIPTASKNVFDLGAVAYFTAVNLPEAEEEFYRVVPEIFKLS